MNKGILLISVVEMASIEESKPRIEKIRFTIRTEKVNGQSIRILSPSRRMTEEEIKRSNKRLGKLIDRILAREATGQ